MPDADRETGRRGGGDEPLLGVVGARRALVDQDHVDRLVQALAVDGLAQPMRDRAVTRDHPAPDRRQARRMGDRFRRERNRRRAGLVLRVLLRVHGRSSDDNKQRNDGDVAGDQHSTGWDWSVNAWLSVTPLLAESDCNFG